MLELLAQTTQPGPDLIDLLNNNAPAIQAFSSFVLVVITGVRARPSRSQLSTG